MKANLIDLSDLVNHRQRSYELLNDLRVFKEQSSNIDWKGKDENDQDYWIFNSWFYSFLVSLSDELPLVCSHKYHLIFKYDVV